MKKFLKLNLLVLFVSSSIGAIAQEGDIEAIKRKTSAFSAAYVNADYEAMANAYTIDGRILPPGPGIITGREAIKARWVLPENTKILKHVVTPEEIKIMGDHAYDVGYYEGTTQSPNGDVSNWKGKYLIVWKKVDGDWFMHLDAWNRVSN